MLRGDYWDRAVRTFQRRGVMTVKKVIGIALFALGVVGALPLLLASLHWLHSV
jgi:hypothetical protein